MYDDTAASPERPPTTAASLSIRLFGSFDARLYGEPLLDLKSREGERLLAFVLLQHARPVEAMAVAALFWPETGSLDSLRHSVGHIRSVLGAEGGRLHSARGTLSFRVEGADIDLVAFDRLVAEDDPASLALAVRLYTGPLLAAWDERWAQPFREARHEAYLGALDTLARHATEAGEPLQAVRWLRQRLRADPSAEHAWQDLIRAYVLAGERTRAMDIYERYRKHLHTRYRLEPPAELTALYRDLRENMMGTTPPAETTDPACEPVGGTVPPASPLYIERPADALLLSALTRQESIVLIKGPRQTGKSSLMARGLHRVRRQGTTVLFTDLEQFSPEDFASMETLCRRLCATLAAQQELDVSLDALWKPLYGPGVNLERFLLRQVLESLPGPVVWALDEVDRLFPHPYSGEVFALLRSWHEKRFFEPDLPWRRLTLALCCATEAHLYIRDLNRSPFNVGVRLPLEDFSRAQVEELNRRHDGPLSSPAQIARFYDLTGGHPYLVRRGLLEICMSRLDLETLCTCAAQDTGPFGDHLRRLLRHLNADQDLRAAVLLVLEGRSCPPESIFRLRSAGVLTGESEARVRLRCRLYADYLTKYL